MTLETNIKAKYKKKLKIRLYAHNTTSSCIFDFGDS